MGDAELRGTPEWKWVAVAACKEDSRPILMCVRVEPSRLIAADGYRLRVVNLKTGVAAPELLWARSDGPVNLEPDKYPDIKRLWRPRERQASVVLNAPTILPLIKELLTAHKPREQAERYKHAKPTPAVQFYTKRKSVWLARVSVPRLTPGANAMDLPDVRLGAYDGVQFQTTVNARWVQDALTDASAVTLDWVKKNREVRFKQRGRYEVIMPIFLDR